MSKQDQQDQQAEQAEQAEQATMQAPASELSADAATLASYAARIETLALTLGLEFPRVDFELVPDSFMAEIAIYGLPVRMRHWSFGVRYIHQLVHQKMGHSHIFEVMFPGDPCHAYMAEHNSVAENTLVTAHVLGHADFASRNALFQRFGAMVGTRILEHSAARALRIEAAVRRHGQDKVEAVLDAALALEQHVDVHAALHRPAYPDPATGDEAADATGPVPPFAQRYQRLPGESAALAAHEAHHIVVRDDVVHAPARHHQQIPLVAQAARVAQQVTDAYRLAEVRQFGHVLAHVIVQ